MQGKYPALRDTIARQSTVGNVMLILIAIYLLSPYISDRLMNEPSLRAEISTSFSSSKGVLVHDKIRVSNTNRGTRNNILMDKDGTIMCLKSWPNMWMKNRDREYSLEAFVGCDKAVTVPFRVCSVFVVNSRGGIYRRFGDDNEFCSEYMNPITNG